MLMIDQLLIRCKLMCLNTGLIMCDKSMSKGNTSTVRSGADGRKFGGAGRSFADSAGSKDIETSVKNVSSPFEYLNNNDIYTEKTGDAGALIPSMHSIYVLLMVVGVIGLVCSVMVMALKLQLFKDGNTKAEVKSGLYFKCAIAVGLFSCLTLLGVYHTFVSGLF